MDYRFLPGAFWESEERSRRSVVVTERHRDTLTAFIDPDIRGANWGMSMSVLTKLPGRVYRGNIADAVEMGCRALALVPRRFGAKVAGRLPDTWYADDAPEGSRGLNWDDMVRRDYQTGELVGEAMAGLVALHSWPPPRERFAEFRAALEARAKTLPGLKAVCDLTSDGILLELECEGERTIACLHLGDIDWDDLPNFVQRRFRLLSVRVGMKRMMRAR